MDPELQVPHIDTPEFGVESFLAGVLSLHE